MGFRGKVLIVDDMEDNLLLLEAILEPEGFDVFKAKSGEDGFKILEKEKIDLIILDVLMPGMDGYRVCEKLRESYEYRFIPVIMLTALNRREDVIKGLECGADDFISKPVDDDLLLVKVKSLVNLKKSREEVEQLKNELNSMIVHDLKTPVHSILSCCELIREEKPSERVLKYVGLIEKSGNKLRKMIERFLSVSRIENNRLSLNLKDEDIVSILQSVLAEISAISGGKGIKILFHNSLKDRVILSLDREKIEEAFLNLLENSLKFTPDGGRIDIFLERTDDKIVIKFRDNGCGIKEGDRENIFEKYVKGDHPESGSGLGLYITRGIVEAHGGKIYLDREYRSGAQFVVEFPLK